jgi:hypothetical protein
LHLNYQFFQKGGKKLGCLLAGLAQDPCKPLVVVAREFILIFPDSLTALLSGLIRLNDPVLPMKF